MQGKGGRRSARDEQVVETGKGRGGGCDGRWQ